MVCAFGPGSKTILGRSQLRPPFVVRVTRVGPLKKTSWLLLLLRGPRGLGPLLEPLRPRTGADGAAAAGNPASCSGGGIVKSRSRSQVA
jgi:hypothetical protein